VSDPRSERPLAGLRVVDLADEKGELCGRLLADLGADVLRIEPPGGARSRSLPPIHQGASLGFALRNAGKRGATLDLSAAAGRARLHELLAAADVLIESFEPAERARLTLDPGDLLARHPHLVFASLSDFGSRGPYRDWVATDDVLDAMGGMVFKAGVAAKPPLIPPAAIGVDVASVTAAYAVLLALYQRRLSGAGQHIDFSTLLGIAQTTDWSFCNASILRNGKFPINEVRQGSGPVYTIYACKGGYVRLIVLSPRQWRAMWEWLGKPEAFADPHWETFVARLQNADLLTKLYEAHFASMSMEEVSEEAQRRGIVCTPVLRPDEVLRNEHLRARGTFVELPVAPGVRGPFASGFLEVDGVRQGPGQGAPAAGADDSAAFLAGAAKRALPRPGVAAPAAPLAGIRVLDFGIGGVGVEAGRLLAEYGAEVIKVETRSYPDFMRTVTGGWTSPSFASSSRSKQSFGVNVKKPEGLAQLKKLIAQSDVIIENSATGTMDDMGIGWSTIQALNPRAILVSSQLMGSRGPWASWIGYGPSTQPVGGLVHLWNYDDQDFPAGSAAIFPDHLVGRICALGAMAGLLSREGSGSGSHVEAAQIEAVTGMLGELLLKAGLAPGSVKPRGNWNARGAPWGAYPCAGEQQWIVITVRDDADWQRLREAMGDPDWARDAAWGKAAGRLAQSRELDAKLGEWTRQHAKRELAALLQQHGVPAGPVFTGTDMLDDPHFQAWRYAREVEVEPLGRFSLEGPCWTASAMADADVRPAPKLGEHTREIARRLLGLEDAEIEKLVAAGALEDPPPPPQAK
jgi:crotonobetainyl-CoA:carnitine CoA-transferase CaiB-like acyl-CoA transferase